VKWVLSNLIIKARYVTLGSSLTQVTILELINIILKIKLKNKNKNHSLPTKLNLNLENLNSRPNQHQVNRFSNTHLENHNTIA
jgi:hypothetical protein